MTPEERFTKTENFLNSVAEHQARHAEHIARHAEEIAELRQLEKVMMLAIAKLAEEHRSNAKMLTEGRKAVDEALRETAEQQRITEQKLNALIEIVDRIIREKNI